MCDPVPASEGRTVDDIWPNLYHTENGSKHMFMVMCALVCAVESTLFVET